MLKEGRRALVEGMAVRRLDLTQFRNHDALSLAVGSGLIAITGPNGAGKTNILEALSLLGPGRGLRGAPISEMATRTPEGADEPGMAEARSFAVVATIGADGMRLSTGTRADQPGRRLARIDGAAATLAALAERIALIWLTPAMDRLFLDAPAVRRRYLDRLVVALDPRHAETLARHEAALAERNRLLAMPGGGDPVWLDAVEARLAEAGAALAEGRRRLVAALDARLAEAADDGFPRARLTLAGDRPDLDIARDLAMGRARDRAAGRTLGGVHRIDLLAHDRANGRAARLASTGEQKALAIGITLSMAALVGEARGAPPLLLLDEVAAHLDPDRRARLFALLDASGAQCWMTGTDAALFDGLGASASRISLGSQTHI